VLSAEDAGAARGVAVSGDGGYVVAGSVFEAPRGRRASVWRFDRSNKLLWTQVYGDSESFARGVAALPDGGAVVVGAAQAVGAKLRPWIIGVDQGGAQRGMAP
jgi:hypothetical protein